MSSGQRPVQAGQPGSAGSAATQLDFSQAMTDFRVMFPDMDAEVIEAVLRANNGAVDATIDNLLAMTADNEAMAAAAVPDSSHPSHQSTSHQQPPSEKASQMAQFLKSGGQTRSSELPPSYNQAMDRVDGSSAADETGDLINLGGAPSASLLSSLGIGVSAPSNPPQNPATAQGDSLLPNFKDATSSSSPPTVDDLLSDLDLNALGAAAAATTAAATPTTNPVAESPPRQATGTSLAYSHPQRQEHEAFSAATSGTSPRTQGSGGMVPTQAQLQEIYEANLRQREEGAEGASGLASTRDLQFLEDERIALMLQNEEFMAELRRDHEFMSALEMEDERARQWQSEEGGGPSIADATSGQRRQPLPPGVGSSAAAGSSGVMDEAAFREKLKNMGKTSKRKFAQMASIFSNRPRLAGKGAKQLLGHAPAPSKDNLLLNAEPLVNDDDDSVDGDHEVRESRGGRKGSSKTPTKGKYTSFS